jgi:uncharacterized protein (DUF1697 family)
MGTKIALLRGINVGGKNLVAMSGLKNMFDTLGFVNVRTLLQSGNVVFGSAARTPADLEKYLETETVKRLNSQAEFFIRTAEEWEEIVRHNPFQREANTDPGRLVVMALKVAPDEVQLEALRAAIKGRERVEIWNRQAYVYYPDGQGTSKLTPRIIETKLGTRATGRNWNTVLKLLALTE